MPPRQARYNPQQTGLLIDLREAAKVSQKQAAEFFGLNDLGSIRSWEYGLSRPPQSKYRAKFIDYVLNQLQLRRKPQQFQTLWQGLMVETWEWEALTLDELNRHLPHALPAHTHPSPPIFLAPPRPVYALVGRADLLRDMQERLLALGPLVLQGLPGVGKTALAVEMAHDRAMLAHFQEGILWARLGRNPDVLGELGKWATALGMAPTELATLNTITTRAEAVHGAMGLRRLLLVIDDVWDSDVALAFQLGGPNCARLFTTRFPELAAQLAGDNVVTVQELPETQGLALLQTLVPKIVKSEPEGARKLVKAVGSLPLALILLGNYLRSQADSQRDYQLDAGLETLLQTQARLQIAAPQAPLQRHPSLPATARISLQAVIAVSYTHLAAPAQDMLRTLALFPAKPNTFAEAAAVTVATQPLAMLTLLTRAGLVEKSGQDRYMLHQTIADYASLQPMEPAVYARMTTFYATYTADNEKAHDKLAFELNNIQAALQVADAQGFVQPFVQSINALYHFAENRGLYPWIEPLLQRAMQLARAAGDMPNLVKLLYNQSQLAIENGNPALAAHCCEEGLRLTRPQQDPPGGDKQWTARFLHNLGKLAAQQGQNELAHTYWRDALPLAQSVADHDIQVGLFSNLGVWAAHQGKFDEARTYLQAGLDLARRYHYPEKACGLLNNLARIELEQGAWAAAEVYLAEGVKLAQATHHRLLHLILLTNQGFLCFKQKQLTVAEATFQEALTLARALQHPAWTSDLLQYLGEVAIARGALEEAEQFVTEGMALAETLGNPNILCEGQLGLGTLYLKQARWPAAAVAFQTALTLAQQNGMQRNIASALFGLAQATFGQGQAVAARTYGEQSLALMQQIAYVDTPEVAQWLAQFAVRNDPSFDQIAATI